jgi:hypothetical protein
MPKQKAPQLSLMLERSKPMQSLQDYSILLYGERKIGKTSLVAEFKDVYFLMCEPGGKSLAIHKQDIGSWRELEFCAAELLKHKEFPFVCIDTADQAWQLCQTHVCRELGVEHPSELGYARGWHKLRDTFKGAFNPLLQQKGVIFISHMTESEVTSRSGSKFNRIQPTLSGQGQEYLEAVVDIWVYYHYREGERWLQVQGDDLVGAGSRVDGRFLNAKTGAPLQAIPMGNSAAEAYQHLMLAWENKWQPTAAALAETKRVSVPVRRLTRKRSV